MSRGIVYPAISVHYERYVAQGWLQRSSREMVSLPRCGASDLALASGAHGTESVRSRSSMEASQGRAAAVPCRAATVADASPSADCKSVREPMAKEQLLRKDTDTVSTRARLSEVPALASLAPQSPVGVRFEDPGPREKSAASRMSPAEVAELDGQTGVREGREMTELDPFEDDPEGDDAELQAEDSGAKSTEADVTAVVERRRRRSPVPLSGSALPLQQRLKINLDLELYRAKCLIRAGKMAVAEEKMRKAILDWPDDGRPYVVLGRLLAKQGKSVAARAVYEQGCQALGGDNAFIWQCWAVLEARLGNKGRARRLFDAATAADEKHAAAWHGWAMLELRDGNTGRARQLLERGAKHCGESAYILQSLALLAIQNGRLSDARALFLRCTQLNPRGAASWLAWALLEASQGEPSSARLLFEKALDASPKNKYVWQAWGVFEESQGNLDLARKLLTRGVQLHPKDAVMLQSLALLEYNCGFTGGARALFREAAEADPLHQPVWNAWGWMEWREARLDTARQLFQKSIEISSTSPGAARAYQAWGVLEEREGNVAFARTLYKRALRADPSNDVVWRTWVAMEERVGNAVRADELRSLYQQQRVEIVETSWDLSSFITPALDTVRNLFWGNSKVPLTPNSMDSIVSRSPPIDGALEQKPLPVDEDKPAALALDPIEIVRKGREARTTATGQQEAGERVFDVDEFLACRLPRTFTQLASADSLKEKSKWRRPVGQSEARKWKRIQDR